MRDTFTESASPEHYDDIAGNLKKLFDLKIDILSGYSDDIENGRGLDFISRGEDSERIASSIEHFDELFAEGVFGQDGYEDLRPLIDRCLAAVKISDAEHKANFGKNEKIERTLIEWCIPAIEKFRSKFDDNGLYVPAQKDATSDHDVKQTAEAPNPAAP